MGAFDTKDPLGLEAAYHKKVSSTDAKDPFGLEDALKKKVDTAGSSSSSQSSSSESPSNISQTSQLPFELESLQKKDHNNPAPFIDESDKQKELASQKKASSQNIPGFREVKDDPTDRIHRPDVRIPTKEQIAADNPDGEWSVKNVLSQLYGGTGGTAKQLSGSMKFNLLTAPSEKLKSLANSLANAFGIKPAEGSIAADDNTDPNSVKGYLRGLLDNAINATVPGTGSTTIEKATIPYLDKASEGLEKQASDNPLPDTFSGKLATGLLRLAPELAAFYATRGESAEAEVSGYAGKYLTNSEILQQALTKASGPFTRYLAVTKGLEGINKGYNESGGKILPTIEEGANQATGGVLSGMLLEGQMATGEQIGKNLFDLAKKTGVTDADGVITEQALKSIIGTPTAFAASSVADDLGNGRPINWQNAGISAATALPFEATHFIDSFGAAKTLEEKKTALQQKAGELVDKTNANEILNFASAHPEDIDRAMSRPESAAELQILALAKGVEAQDAKTYEEINNLHLQQLQLQQHADIKSVGDAIIQHGAKGFTEAVNATELPDEVKSTLLDKANSINEQFNPVIVEQRNTQAKVEDLTSKIDELQAIPGATNPIENPAGVADLIDKVDERTDLQVGLLEKAVNNPEQIPNRQVLYHGSSEDFETFDDQKLGLFTNSESAKKGFFFTSSPDVANSYKEAGVKNRPNIDALKEHLESLSEKELKSLYKDVLGKYSGYSFDPEHPKDAIDDLIDAAKEDKGNHILDKKFVTEQIFKHVSNDNRGYKAYETDGKLHQVHLDMKNPLIVDAEGQHPSEFDINTPIDEAKANGHDGLIVKNLHDEALLNEKGSQYDPSDIHIVFDRDQIKKIENEQGEVQKENEAPAAAETTIDAEKGNLEARVLEGGFQFKSKEHGTLNIAPEENGEYTVHFQDGQTFKGTPEEIRMALPDFDESKIGAGESDSNLHGTDDPKEIASIYDNKLRELQDTGSKEGAIAAYGPRTDKDNFGQFNDPNNITGGIRLNYFKNKNGSTPALDVQADEINRQYFNGAEVVHPNDIAEFMVKYPGGERSYYTPAGNPELRDIANRYKEVTGKNLSTKTAEKLAKEYSNVTEPEIRDIQERFDTPENTEKIKQFIEDELSKPGLHEVDVILDNLSNELDRYVADPDNQFNLFHDVYQGDILSEEEIKSIKNEIEQAKSEQLAGGSDGEESANETGSEAPVGEESERGQPEPVTEDDLPFQRASGEPIPQERVDAIQGLMKKVFPNVETLFHPTVEGFSEAARTNGIGATDLPNAFVDKNGRINFNPDSIHADTQIHEYGHILTQWAKENAPALYQRMIAFGRDATDIHKELSGNGYKISGPRLAEEAFVTMLGRHGEGKLDDVIKNSGTRGTVSKFINDLWTKFQRYLIDKTGFDLSKFKNIKDMPINEFLDMVNSKYLLSDTKVSDIGTREYSNVSEQKSSRPVKMEGEGMADYFKRVIDWTKEQQTGQKAIDFEKSEEPEGADFELETNKYKEGYNFSETSIKNRKVAEERRARFLDEVEAVTKRDFGTVWDRGKSMVDDGKLDPKVLADNIINNPRPLSAEETAALTYDRMRLYNDHRITMDNINDAMESNNAGAETEARARLAYIEERINTNDIASRQAGYEQGLGLAARRMIAAQDYSLANQNQLATVANGGRELPADIRMKLESLSKQLQDAEKKLADHEANAGERAAKQSLARLKKEAELEQRTERKQKRTQSKEQIKKNIEDIKSSIFDKLTRNKGLSSSILPYADKLAEITPDLARLAKEYVKSGIVTVEGIVDAVHADIKDHLEGITKRDVRDALSGYGKTSKPNKDEIESQLRELKSQARLTSALEDAQAGQRPLKSGYTREKPSDQVRDLQKQVHDAMRENGIEVQRDPISEEDAWKTALESVKTRLKNQITDLNKQIETGIKPEKSGRIIYDQEANDLKAERDRLQKAIEETEGNKELTDAERVEILTKSTEKSIEEYKKRIDELKDTGKDTVAEEKSAKRDKLKDLIESTPELKALKERLGELQDEHAKIVDEAKPKRTPEEIALDAFKKRMTNKIAELEERIKNEDYAPKPKKEPIALDEEGKKLKSEVRKIQRKFDENREKLRLANRSKLEKRLDWAAKYRRFILLSNITTIAKLSAAGATRLITSPLEEVAGHALSVVPGIDKISAMAPREGGGLSIKAEAESLAKVLSRNSINEMVRTIREGKSQLDERVDQKEKTHKEGGFFELPGHIHAALKTVPKQVEYYRSLQKRIEFALRNGYDITSPDVQTSLQMEAFKDQNPELFKGKTVEMSALEYQAFQDGKRAIFMQDNFLSDEWTAMIKRWENKGPKGAVAATIARIFLPIIKIPTNFVAESSSLAFGGVKAVFALRNGVEKLTPDEADYVMRALKKQSIGAAFFAMGYFLPQYVGGFYRKDEKRKKGSPEADDLVILGEKVPHWLMHAPVFEVMQMGATVRRVHDQYQKNSKVSTGDEIVTSTLSATKGLFGQVPMFGEAADLTRGLETAESLKKFSANFVLGLVAPYDVQRLAKWMDEDSHGDVIKRKEKGFIQHLESGIPIVRSHELKKK